MSPTSGFRGAITFALALLAMLPPLAAQTPGSRRTVSAVGQLGLGDTAVRTGVMRQLVCRGKQGIDLRADEASPDARLMRMTLQYPRSSQTAGLDYAHLEPGACTWNPGGFDGVPAEPGIVHFDVPREAQPWSFAGERQLDTTVTAAEHYADVHSMARYLSEPAHYWVFFVDDATNFSMSFGAHVRERRPPTLTTVKGTYATRTGASVLSDGISGSVRDASPKRATSTDRFARERTPGSGNSAVVTLVQAPLRLVAVNTVLDRFTIQFSARPDASPTVRYSTVQPVKQPGTEHWTFPGGVLQGSGAVEGGIAAEVAGGGADGFRATYSAWSRVAPQRGMPYHFIITVPATPDQPEQQFVGRFSTVGQQARVVFTSYSLTTRWRLTRILLFPGEGTPLDPPLAAGAHQLTAVAKDIIDAPDQLTVTALGKNWDGPYPYPHKEYDEASASAVLNLGVSPLERYVRIPFRIRSAEARAWISATGLAPYPAVLAFEFAGYIEVTRR